MEANPNLSSVIHAYSEGQIFEQYGRPTWRLGEYERLLVETHCPGREAAILNLGCGGGRETFALYGMGYRNLTGLDCTESLLEMARRHDAELGSHLEFVLGAVEKMPFADNRFEAVTFFENVYGHITPRAARRQSMQEIARVLKPGGVVFLVCNSLFHYWRYGIYIRLTDVLHRFYNPRGMEAGDRLWGRERRTSGDGKAGVKIHWFTMSEVEEDAAHAGLNVVTASTQKGILRNPTISDRRTHKQGWLVFVLKKEN